LPGEVESADTQGKDSMYNLGKLRHMQEDYILSMMHAID